MYVRIIHVRKGKEFIKKILGNYEALIESENEVQQWLQERMYKHGNDGEDQLEECYWRMAWRSLHGHVLYHRSKMATWEEWNRLRLMCRESGKS